MLVLWLRKDDMKFSYVSFEEIPFYAFGADASRRQVVWLLVRYVVKLFCEITKGISPKLNVLVTTRREAEF